MRNNLTLVLADPHTLPIAEYAPVENFDPLGESGNSLMLLWDGDNQAWDTLLPTIKQRFPIKSQLSAPSFKGPIRTAKELEDELDVTLTNLLGAMARDQTVVTGKTDAPPAQISSFPDAPK